MSNVPLLLVAGFIGVLVVLFAVMMRVGSRVEMDYAARLEQSKPGRATVIQVWHSHDARSGGVVMDLTLAVMPEVGSAYQSTVTWQVERACISKVQIGQIAAVNIDASDPKRIYPVAIWARFIVIADNV